MKFKEYILLVGVALIAVTSCNKNTTASALNTVKKTVTDVYLTGYIIAKNHQPVATYWKNGVAKQLALDTTTTSTTNSITISDTDVYITGYADGYPCYWKNGGEVKLPNQTVAYGLSVSGKDIYLAGITEVYGGATIATLWKNGVATLLSSSARNAYALDVEVLGSDIYVAGVTITQSGVQNICYWKNGIQTSLSTNTGTTFANIYYLGTIGLAFLGSDMYISGSVYNTSTLKTLANYWKNDIPTPLVTDGSTTSSGTNAITISGTNVYMAGYDNGIATYWENGKAYKLSGNGVQNYIATGIAVNNGIVYVAGYALGGYANAVYWNNGSLINLSTRPSETTGIAVLQH